MFELFELIFSYCFNRPATVLLIVGGGLVYSYPSLNAEGVNITLLLIVLFFIVICLKTKQDTQLKVAKVLTFFFAVVMSVVIVGLVLKVCYTSHLYYCICNVLMQ